MRVFKYPVLCFVFTGVCFLGSFAALGQESFPDYIQFEIPRGELGFKTEDRESETTGSASQSKSGYNYESLNLRTKLTIYDPRFIEIMLGGGLLYGQGQDDAEGQHKRINNYSLSANILKKHPYSGNVYLRKRNIETYHSPSSTYEMEEKDSGVRVSLKEKLGLILPLDISVTKSHRTTHNLYDQIDTATNTDEFYKLDESTRTIGLSSRKNWGPTEINLEYTNKKVDTTYTSNYADKFIGYEEDFIQVGNSGRVGENGAFQWRLLANERSQTAAPEYTRKNASADIKFKLYDNPASSLYALTGYGISKEERVYENGSIGRTSEFKQTLNKRGGFEHRLFKSLYTDLKFHQREQTYPGFERVEKETLLGTRYIKSLPGGRVYSGYSIAFKSRKDIGDAILSTYSELGLMIGFNPVELAEDNVDVTTLKVTDRFRTLVYIENTDYRVYQVGRKTYIERIPGTRILDGEQVLLDYNYTTPRGFLKEKVRRFNFGIRWQFMEPYYRYMIREQELIQGDEELLNPGRNITYGLKLNQELWHTVTPEYQIELEKDKQRVDTYTRLSRNGALRFNLTVGLNLVLYFKHTQVNHLNDDQDKDDRMQGWNVNYERGRMTLALGASDESSIVGANQRQALVGSSSMTVKYYQWTLGASYRKAHEQFVTAAPSTPSVYERKTTLTTLSLKRVF